MVLRHEVAEYLKELGLLEKYSLHFFSILNNFIRCDTDLANMPAG